MAKHWYSYLGPCPINTSTDATAASNYVYVNLYGEYIGLACPCGTCPCAIYATGGTGPGVRPNSPLSANVTQYITTALFLQTRYPQATKSFVYTRG